MIHTSYQHAQLCQGHGQEEGKGWLSPEPHGPKYLEKGNEVVIGDGLQDTWCTGGRGREEGEGGRGEGGRGEGGGEGGRGERERDLRKNGVLNFSLIATSKQSPHTPHTSADHILSLHWYEDRDTMKNMYSFIPLLGLV